MPKKTLNKSDIIEEIVHFEPPKSRSEKIVNALFNEMIQNLKEGKRIEFRGFGSFAAKEYEGYVGRNPDTGEETVKFAKSNITHPNMVRRYNRFFPSTRFRPTLFKIREILFPFFFFWIISLNNALTI